MFFVWGINAGICLCTITLMIMSLQVLGESREQPEARPGAQRRG